jgi:hypothetical protein
VKIGTVCVDALSNFCGSIVYGPHDLESAVTLLERQVSQYEAVPKVPEAPWIPLWHFWHPVG